MRCPVCDADAPATARFCPSCGRALSSSDTARAGDVTRTSLPSEAAAQLAAGLNRERFPPGTIIAHRYRFTGFLGRGGMGDVYRADDLRLGQPVALKFLPPAIARDPARLAQFHNEARTARQVSHPNVCRMYDIGEWEDQVFLTMEYVDGEDLSSLIRRIGRLPEDKGLEIARQICAGLAAAHERGVIHRDLKPANVMLDGAGKVRLMDFSLASAGGDVDARAGTPAYMAPEQLEGREVTRQSDVYSLGLVLYELFTGRRAFDAASLPELIAQRESAAIVPPIEWVKTLDPSIERAILRCLSDDPRHRPSSALAVSALLPGGDPLAAALAAGETPSPEMVAAAGTESPTMSAAAGAGWLIVACALAILVGALFDRSSLLAHVPLDKSRPVLVDRADTLRRQFGYTDAAVDAASGFDVAGAYLSWADRRGAGADRWTVLANGRPAAIRFWYRTSPSTLEPFDDRSSVSPGDPPPLVAGMTRFDLDMQGRLLRFEAVPDVTLAAAAPAVDWDSLFDAAGLDRRRFSDVPAELRVRGNGDERRAWEGTDETSPVRWHIDAAGYRGRPTLFDVSGEWARRDSVPAAAPASYARIAAFLVLTLLPFGAAILAWRNLKTGRGDRRGAFRTSAFAFATSVLAWIVSPWHIASTLEIADRFYVPLGQVLYRGGLLYVYYLALEPYVRRTWPTVLVTWSRVVAGRLRDPLVGRDLLVGTVAGFALALTTPVFVLLPYWMGRPEPQLWQTSLWPLYGERAVFWRVLLRPTNALGDGMLIMLILSLFRQALRLLASKLTGVAGRILRSDVLLWLIGVAFFVMLIERDGFYLAYFWFELLTTGAAVAGLFYVALRFGLFALVLTLLTYGLTTEIGLTLALSKPYAADLWFVAGTFLVLAAIGAWLVRAGRPAFGQAR
jgi:serine/threonine-protein kinase